MSKDVERTRLLGLIALADKWTAELDPDSSRWHCWNSRGKRWRKELAKLARGIEEE